MVTRPWLVRFILGRNGWCLGRCCLVTRILRLALLFLLCWQRTLSLWTILMSLSSLQSVFYLLYHQLTVRGGSAGTISLRLISGTGWRSPLSICFSSCLYILLALRLLTLGGHFNCGARLRIGGFFTISFHMFYFMRSRCY